MKKLNNAMKLIALAAIVTAGTFWGVTKVSAASDPLRSTGMFGITSGQTARLNIFFVEDAATRVELSFVDGDGNILSQKVIDSFSLKSGFLDLRGVDLPRTHSSRTQVRAVVRFIDSPDIRVADDCISSLEVFDNESGETRFLVPAVQKVLDPAVR